MEKGNAHDYVQDRDVDPRPLLTGIAAGLQYLHDFEPNPVYHGDLKGFNVLISNDGDALLADFGLSVSLSPTFNLYSKPIGGTLNWMAPEYLESQECNLTAEGDVWAFGMTVLELFTREPPFHELKALASLIAQVLQGPPPRPTDEKTCFRMSDEWWKICTSCWIRDPSRRPRMSDINAIIPRESS
ncbi:hypothetical protein ID866_7320 [Astraeus odoratus]|nr:hypothetical protein ID866_7320 [Astraeus odoratus]